MMGRLERDQGQFFYSFDLDAAVPADHLVRGIDAVLDLGWVRDALAPYYSHTGRPSIDPELMLRMLILGYVFAIRSERQLCREVQVNLAYRWFCGLGLEDATPNHSAFSRARHARFRDSNILRQAFEQVVERCVAAGLVGGEGFAVDASLIQADANKQRSVPGPEWHRRDQPPEARRAVREYIDTLDDAAFGAASEVMPKFVSPSDPAAQWTGALRGPAFFAYATNYLIDTRHAIIVDVEATRAIRQAEVGAARTMLDRTMDRFGLTPRRLAGDSAYGSATMLAWLVGQRGIAPHIPVIEKSGRKDGTLERADFRWNAENNRYICPRGRFLKTTGRPTADGKLLYRSKNRECAICPLKPKCCPNTPYRKIPRDLHEDARDVARSLARTPAFEQSRRDRKRVEMLFAHLKRILRLGRLRLRGPCGARDEFLLAATAQNLRRLAKLTAKPPAASIPIAA